MCLTDIGPVSPKAHGAAEAVKRLRTSIRATAIQAIGEFHKETGLLVNDVRIEMLNADTYSRDGDGRAAVVGEIHIDIRG